MANKTTPFNPFDYMDSQDEINAFLRESLYKTFNGNTQPKWSTIFKVTNVIGLHLAVT